MTVLYLAEYRKSCPVACRIAVRCCAALPNRNQIFTNREPSPLFATEDAKHGAGKQKLSKSQEKKEREGGSKTIGRTADK